MTRLIFAVFLAVITCQLHAQENQGRFDLRIGSGISLLGTGDMITFNYENELNFKFNPHFASAVSLNYGRSNDGVFTTISFIQGNLNIFFSPLRNDRRNDFRIGTGISYYNISEAYVGEIFSHNEQTVFAMESDNRNAFGYNFIIENTYAVTSRFLLGMKLFSQPYTNGDVNTGVLLKLGLKL